MTSLLIITGNKFSVFFSNRNLHFVSVMKWVVHPDDWMNQHMFQMSNLLHDILYLILLHLQLEVIAHMLQLATTTMHMTSRINPFFTCTLQLNQFTEPEIFIHFDYFNNRFFPR